MTDSSSIRTGMPMQYALEPKSPCTNSASARQTRRQRRVVGRALLLTGACIIALPGIAQQKTGPGITGDDSLTWHGITLYGVIDIGLQYDTHSAPFTPYRPAASGNIVRSNDYQSSIGATPSNMGQSRVGLQGNEPL